MNPQRNYYGASRKLLSFQVRLSNEGLATAFGFQVSRVYRIVMDITLALNSIPNTLIV